MESGPAKLYMNGVEAADVVSLQFQTMIAQSFGIPQSMLSGDTNYSGSAVAANHFQQYSQSVVREIEIEFAATWLKWYRDTLWQDRIDDVCRTLQWLAGEFEHGWRRKLVTACRRG